jgi:polyisoprenoid-binding protein YceI
MKAPRVLVLASSAKRREQLVASLRDTELKPVSLPDPQSGADALATPEFDAVLLDLTAPELDLPRLRQAIFPSDAVEPDSLEAAERRHLALMLRHTAGNKRRAAHLLGISRSTLLNKVRKYGLSLVIFLSLTASGQGQTPNPIPSGEVSRGTLSFDGHATVGDFVGTTDSVSGRMAGGANLSAVRGWVEAPVRTLKTGDKRRDKDLNKSMESDKYPNIRFQLERLTPREGKPDSIPVVLHGTLLIHGVSRKVDLPAVIAFQDNQARVRSNFPLNLKDYRIGGLSKMLGLLKMSENIEVHVDLLFGLAPGG